MGCTVHSKNPCDHSYSPQWLRSSMQHWTQSSTGAMPPGAGEDACQDTAPKALPWSQPGSLCSLTGPANQHSAVRQPQHWQRPLQQLALSSEGVSLPPWLTTFLPAKCKTMNSTFPSWQRWGLDTSRIFKVFWFGITYIIKLIMYFQADPVFLEI